MDSTALFKPPLLLNPSQDDATRGSLTSPLPVSVFQKYNNCLRLIQENNGTAQNIRVRRILEGSFPFRLHLLSIAVQSYERGRNLATKLSEGIVTVYRANPCMRE